MKAVQCQCYLVRFRRSSRIKCSLVVVYVVIVCGNNAFFFFLQYCIIANNKRESCVSIDGDQ